MSERPSQEPQEDLASPESTSGEEPVPTQPEMASSEEELEQLKAELEKKSQEAQELMDKYLRTYAELENFKKRVVKDQAEWIKYANEGLLRELLPVTDNLERALGHAKSVPELSQWVAGIALTVKQFEEILAKFGVTAIQTLGLPFDPSVHQAMLQVEREVEEGTVVEELQKGYFLHDRVLRPALVAVAKKRSDVGDEKPEAKSAGESSNH